MTRAAKDRAPPKSIPQLVQQLAYRHSSWQVFGDFVEMAAISLSNATDLAQRPKRGARYLEIIERYRPRPEEVQLFPQMLGVLVAELEKEPRDVLGQAFHELELHNKWTGQFFTPHHLCRCMAKMVVGDGGDIQQKISERGYLTASEPASGSGAMIIALALELKAQGVNYQQQLHVTAVDVDAKCVHMTYAQLALLHIPAVVVHGNSLTLEEFGRWYTPAHILGGWNFKLRAETAPVADDVIEPERPGEPVRPAHGKPHQLTLF